jgi:DNA-binding transcriptional regulator GbsR (MarR family)
MAGSEPTDGVAREFIQDFGEAYLQFGLPRLMGHVVGLLLSEPGPLSLDAITERLQVSKGPVSQVMRRLRDAGLVEKQWVPGSRRDYYRAHPDIFGRAFANHAALLRTNLELARRYRDRVDAGADPHFATRVAEMEAFYARMVSQLSEFLGAWQREWESSWKDRIDATETSPATGEPGAAS